VLYINLKSFGWDADHPTLSEVKLNQSIKTFQHPRQKISPDFIDSKLQNYSNISSGGERVITPENDAH